MSKPNTLGRERQSVDLSAIIPWKNISGEIIPAYGVVQLRDDVVSRLSQANKPDSGEGLFFAAGERDTDPNAKGESLLWNRARRVLLSGSARVGDRVGPVEGSWEMSSEGSGFRVVHQPVTGIAIVLPFGGGGGAGESIWFTVDEGPVCDPYGVDDPYLLVTAERYTGGCGKTPPYAEYGGQYKIYQWCPNDFGPAGSMGGSKGKASLSWPLEGYCEPQWLLDFTCYEPDCP